MVVIHVRSARLLAPLPLSPLDGIGSVGGVGFGLAEAGGNGRLGLARTERFRAGIPGHGLSPVITIRVRCSGGGISDSGTTVFAISIVAYLTGGIGSGMWYACFVLNIVPKGIAVGIVRRSIR